jgi:hypothetical protein
VSGALHAAPGNGGFRKLDLNFLHLESLGIPRRGMTRKVAIVVGVNEEDLMSGAHSDPTRACLTADSSKSLFWGRLVLATFGAAGAGFALHVLYGRGWAESYVQSAARTGRLNNILHEPYPSIIVALAFMTALLPAAGKVDAFLLLRKNLPGHSRVTKGLWFGLLLMAMTDALIRVPFMSVAIGNPVDVMLIQRLEGWLIGMATGIAIALLVP